MAATRAPPHGAAPPDPAEVAGPVLPGRHGAPRWPRQTVGSLTHCAGRFALQPVRTGACMSSEPGSAARWIARRDGDAAAHRGRGPRRLPPRSSCRRG
ncbi:hypothetical protein ACWGI8_09070 [Streptomyces sp. NPDC054841]